MSGVVIGVVVGWVSAPGFVAASTVFTATNTSIFDFGAGGPSQFQAVVLATQGPVPRRVAGRLGVDVSLVQSKVAAEFRSSGSVLLITGRSTNPAQAEALANVTAEELNVELGGPKSPLRTLERAVASPEEGSDVVGPRSRPSRAFMLGAFGLVIGFGAALVVERLDNRIRSKAAAEEVLGVPVMAEVPAMSRADREQMVLGGQPSAFIEAYRGLRTGIDRWWSQAGDGDSRRVIVVTTPVGGEGATTTVAHLAAALGEIGRTVVVISADLRHPRLHLYFNKAQEPGLVEVLRGAPDTRRLVDLNLTTTIRGVRMVASGAPVRNPAPLLGGIGEHLRDASSLGDFVLVDVPPLLTTSDGADLARHADGVLLVVRIGGTSVGAAARCAELLERLDIPLIGAVLVGSEGAAART